MTNQEPDFIESLQMHVDNLVVRDGEQIVDGQESAAKRWVGQYELQMRYEAERVSALEARKKTEAMGMLTAFVLNEAAREGNKNSVPDACFYDEIPKYRTNWRGKTIIDRKLTVIGFEGWRLGSLNHPSSGEIVLRSDADEPKNYVDGLTIVRKSAYKPEHSNTSWQIHRTRPIPVKGETTDDAWALKNFCLEQIAEDELKEYIYSKEPAFKSLYDDTFHYPSIEELRRVAERCLYPTDIERALRDSLANLLVSKGIVEIVPGVSSRNDETIDRLRRKIRFQK